MTKGYVPSSKPSDVQQDSKEQFKTTGTSFQQKLNPFKSQFKCTCRLVCQIVVVIWLICYGKQNNGILKYVLKQDSSYSLCLDYNNLSSSMCSGNLFLCFRLHYGIFPTLIQVWTAVFKIICPIQGPGSRMHKILLFHT